jgi:hypothetical protein
VICHGKAKFGAKPDTQSCFFPVFLDALEERTEENEVDFHPEINTHPMPGFKLEFGNYSGSDF